MTSKGKSGGNRSILAVLGRCGRACGGAARRARLPRPALWVLGALALAGGAMEGRAAIGIDSNWTGLGGNTLYSNPANWNPMQTPINGLDTYRVTIPTNTSVIYDSAGNNQISRLTLSSGDLFSSSTANGLTVIEQTTINNARLAVSGGAVFNFNPTSYSSTALISGANLTLFSASGAGSTLNLSTLTSLNDGFNDFDAAVRIHTISATGGGNINLSSLTTITAPAQIGDILDIVTSGGGTINLGALTTTGGTGGYVRFTTDTAMLTLPALQTADRAFFNPGAGQTVHLPALTSLAGGIVTLNGGGQLTHGAGLVNINNSRLTATGGSILTLTGPTSYNSTGMNFTQTLMSASGAGSKINLTTLTSFTSGFNDFDSVVKVHTVTATGGGNINLSSLTTVTGPAQPEDILDFVTSTGGTISLGSLTTTGGSGGFVRFTTDAAVLNLPALQTADRTLFSPGAGQIVQLPALTALTRSILTLNGGGQFSHGAGLVNINDSRLVATGGSILTLTGPTSYSAANIGFDQTLMSASGPGSIVHLPSLTSLNSGFNDFNSAVRFHTVTATGGGNINLSSLATVTGPARTEDILDFVTSTGGTINLSGLTTTGGSGGLVRFTTDAAVLNLPSLQTADLTIFNAGAGQIVQLPALAALTHSFLTLNNGGQFSHGGGLVNINNSRLTATGGSILTLTGPTSYSSSSLGFSQTLISASGMGATINLNTLTSLSAGFDDFTTSPNTHTITATGGGQVNLAALTTLTGPSRSDDILDVVTSTGGTINLNSLQTINSTFQGLTRFTTDAPILNLPSLQTADRTIYIAGTGQIVQLPALTALTHSFLTLNGGGQFSHGGGLININNSRLAATGGSILTITGPTNYSSTGITFSQTLMSASGTGATINLNTLTSLTAGFDDFTTTQNSHTITATGGGQVNLAGLMTITGPARPDDTLDLVTSTGGTINLNSLTTIGSAGGFTRFTTDAPILNLPSLQMAERTIYIVGAGQIVQLPAITGLTHSFLTLNNGGQFSHGAGLVNINNSRLTATGGSILTLTSPTSYSSTGILFSQTLMSASGAGSRINLPALTSLTTGFDDFTTTPNTHTISATAGGQVNLASLMTITGPTRLEDTLDLVTSTGGTINLANLQTINSASLGNTRFTTDAAVLNLPALQSANRVILTANSGQIIQLPAIQSLNHGLITLNGGGQLVTGGSLVNINNTRLILTGGSTYTLTGPTGYSATNLSLGNITLMSAAGTGGLLNLSALQAFNDGLDDLTTTPFTHSVLATAMGLVNLSGVKTLTLPARVEDTTRMASDGGGRIDLGSLTAIGGIGKLALETTGGGTLRLGPADMPATGSMRSSGAGSRIEGAGSIHLRAGATMELSAGGSMRPAGSFSFDTLVETNWTAMGGSMIFEGAGVHTLELGSLNGGVGGGTATNFAIGRLSIGQGGNAAVNLMDVIDNGNRAGATEALYLTGIDGGPGLELFNNSLLVMHNLNVYANVGGVMTHLNSLFGPGQNTIAFSGGFLRKAAGPGLRGDFNFDGAINALDIDLLLQASRGASKQLLFDLTADSLVSQLDVDELIHNILHTEYGDINLSGTVSIGDLTILAESFGLTTTLGTSWGNGDLNGDQQVSIGDLTILAEHFGFVAPAPLSAASISAIPLPAAWPAGLALLGMAGLKARRRRA